MPPARSAQTAAARRAYARSTSINPRTAPRARPRRLDFVRSLAGLRWDRVGRISLLVVLVLVSVIGVQRALSYFATKAQADRELAIVSRLTHDNAQLSAKQQALSQTATVIAVARQLGMVRVGEHPYSLTR